MNIYAAWSGITNSESIKRSGQKITRTIGIYQRFQRFPRSWLFEQFWQYPCSASTSYRFEFKNKAEPRTWIAARYTRRYEYSWRRFFDCQPARRNPDEVHNDSRNLATSSQERARQTSLDGGYCLMSMTNNHAEGIGTCAQSGMTIPSYLSSEMHLGKFPDHTEFQSWRVNFRTDVCSEAKNLSLALQWIKEIETAKSLDVSSLQNQLLAKTSQL